ncbi:hypothetical protein [Pleurocapsa sp. PCC 7319]|uniref:hypothetical protein n=1 Tax=Pleurocapsa sp. PCC 7319 TaxID=118161 RepID=UPI00037FDA7A|nr:hypothetical protein [Pleurocapsa sp. PCC 7319]
MNKSLIATLGAVTSGLLLLQSCSSSNNIINKDTISNLEDSNDSAVVVPEVKPEAKPDPLAEFNLEKSDRLTSTAKVLAGIKLEDDSSFLDLEKAPIWQAHHDALASSWAKLETQQISKVREWTATELKEINANNPTVFYPFSGPDFLYGYSLFPQAKEMVLVGLEPVGSVPNLTSLNSTQFNSKLQEVRNSLYAILQFSFFRTNDMKVDLQQQGVLPILYVFMARTNNRILDVEYVGLNQEAEIKPLKDDLIPGVKIAYVPEGEQDPRTLYYFSTDLSNDGLNKHPEIAEFVAKLDNPITYLKAASYLMYYDSFTQIKDTILSQSSYLLQDDSGMPLSSFNNNQWDLEFYGNYTTPIALFGNRYQPNLRQIYTSDRGEIKPLNFGIGYQFEVNNSNLMLAKAKDDSFVKPE